MAKKKTTIRLEDELHEFAKEQAKKDERSMNFFVVKLIEKKKEEVESGKENEI